MNPDTDTQDSTHTGETPSETPPYPIWIDANTPMAGPPILQGKILIVPSDYIFPPICIKSGERTDLVSQKTPVHWHPTWVYVLLFLNLLFSANPMLITIGWASTILCASLALAARKSSTLTYCLSRAEKRKETTWHTINWALFLGGLAGMSAAIAKHASGLHIACTGIPMAASIFVYYAKVRQLTAIRVDGASVHIRGIPPHIMRMIVEQTTN